SDAHRIRDSEYENKTQYVQIGLRSAPEPPACLSINEMKNSREKTKYPEIKKYSFNVNDIELLAYHGNICQNVHVPSADDKDQTLLNTYVN
ncbi:unnamed protein product, partial [Didymodactylos carnosus]